jgi:uncharacterized protein (DUF3084 family)
MDPTKSLLRSIKDTISRNNDLLDGWNAERGIRTERMDMKDELATLRAENEQLRREQDAIRNETLEETRASGRPAGLANHLHSTTLPKPSAF